MNSTYECSFSFTAHKQFLPHCLSLLTSLRDPSLKEWEVSPIESILNDLFHNLLHGWGPAGENVVCLTQFVSPRDLSHSTLIVLQCMENRKSRGRCRHNESRIGMQNAQSVVYYTNDLLNL